MFILIIAFIALCVGLEAKSNMFVDRPSPTLSAQFICSLFSDFTPEQTNFCMKYPQETAMISSGIENGLRECEEQFKNQRWNCTLTYPDSGLASFGQNRAIQGTKEAAFVTAIVAAGVTHAVSVACARKNISTCQCVRNRSSLRRSWLDQGCYSNIGHGMDISKTFLNGFRGSFNRTHELQMRLNRETGRLAVQESASERCKCYGISGACTSKTCWFALPSTFERVSRFLKAKYDSAIHVEIVYTDTREGKVPTALILPGSNFAKPPKKELVFVDKSPTYCDPLVGKGVAGTRGRICDRLSSASNGCKKLCCGRGYNKIVNTVKTQCKCQFYWCCKVKCETCRKKREITVCK